LSVKYAPLLSIDSFSIILELLHLSKGQGKFILKIRYSGLNIRPYNKLGKGLDAYKE
jgi:hypothetical protein